jgi:hypothetical protein
MRVSISGEKSLIEALQMQMEQDAESSVERVEEYKDLTQQAFGIGEALIIVGIVKGTAELVKLLLELKAKVGSRMQKLQLKTALGITVVELSQDVTAEELYKQLGTIVHQT